MNRYIPFNELFNQNTSEAISPLLIVNYLYQ